MQISKKHNHLLIVLIIFFFSASLTLCTPMRFCGKIPVQAPISDQNSINTSVFSSPTQPNSLVLFNCSSRGRDLVSPIIQNCTHFKSCGSGNSRAKEKEIEGVYSCLFIDDVRKLDGAFDPKRLNCSHYRRVYRHRNSSAEEDQSERYEIGTIVSFDIPDHVPNICEECEKPNGNCGVGLRCICHPRDCKNKVISMSISINRISDVVFSLFCFISLVVLI